MSTVSTRSWKEFIEKLNEHLGSPRRAQTNFCENTEYSLSSLQHWRKTNKVPEAAFSAITMIDRDKCTPSNFAGYHNIRFTQRVVDLSKDQKTLSEIARTLTSEFNRHVTENMIKGIRYRNKDKISIYQSRAKEES